MSCNDPNRRRVLKSFGIAGTTLSTTGVVSAADNSREDTLDTSFDPSSKRETLAFLCDGFEADQKTTDIKNERRRVALDLDTQQVEALSEAFKNDLSLELNVSHSLRPSDSAAIPQDEEYEVFDWSTTVNANVRIKHLDKSFEAFDWAHEATWEGNDAWPPDVKGIEPNAYGDGRHHIVVHWDYQGSTVDDYVIRGDGNYFTSEATGTFEGCLVVGTDVTCSRDDQIYTKIAGSHTGSGTLLEKSVNGTA